MDATSTFGIAPGASCAPLSPPLTECLSRLAHDLRGPLGPLHMAAQLLLDGRPPTAPELRALGRTLGRQTQRMSMLADDLDDVLRIASGCFPLHIDRCDLHACLRDGLDLAEGRARLRGLVPRTIVLRLPEPPIAVLADAARFAQLVALVAGAVAPETDGEIDCHMACERHDGNVHVRLRDASRRIWRSATIDYVMSGQVPEDPGTLALSAIIARTIADAHAATLSIAEESGGRIGELQLVLPEG